GYSMNFTAKSVGCSVSTVRNIMRKFKLTPNKPKPVSEELLKYNVIRKYSTDKGQERVIIEKDGLTYDILAYSIYKFNFSKRALTDDSCLKVLNEDLAEHGLVATEIINGVYKKVKIKNIATGVFTQEPIWNVNVKSVINKTTKHLKYKAMLIDVLGEEKYDYSKTEYRGMKNKSTVTCKEHGDFEIDWGNSIWKGVGCPKCGNSLKGLNSKDKLVDMIRDGKTPTLYLVKLHNDDESFFKIGITTGTVEKRMLQIPYYKYEVVLTKTGTTEYTWSMENELKKICKLFPYTPNKEFAGKTECFSTGGLDLALRIFKR